MTTTRLLRVLLLCPLFMLILQQSWAQNKTVSGKVSDEKGNPISGASVLAKGTNVGTATDASGSFSLNVPSSASVLVISYVGYVSQEVSISSTQNVTVMLQPESSSLSDVVVVGYGTARKKDLTGAVASVKEKDFNKGVITAPDQLIQGKAAGVLVINNSGQPGGSTTIRIRGTSSIRSGNQPLFVIDGVPLSGGSARPGATGGDFGSDGGNPLAFINPSDIASMEILKDASATAIYGSRGANGVVLITTKRGKSGIPQLDLIASSGISNTLKKLEVLTGDEYRSALNKYNLTSGDYGQSEDAWDAISRTALTQNYNIAIGGGNENGRYRLSAGYLDQQGIIETSELKKITANLTSSFKFLDSKKLGLDINVLVTQTNEDIAPVSSFVGFTGNVIAQALQWNPTLKVRDGDSITYLGGTTINPLASLEYYKDKANVNTIIASISPSYKITKELEYKFIYSVNRQVGVRKGYANRLLNLQGIQDRGTAFIANNEQTNQQITNTLNFNKEVSSALNINAVIGHEWLIYDSRSNYESGYDFNNIGLNYYDYLQYSTSSDRAIGSYSSPSTELQSFFARAILNYKDKYLVTGTFRADGSTKFGENNKYGYFPSVGVAWNIMNESFMNGNNIFNNLKLRLGWGQTGNQEFPSGASLNRFSLGQQSISRTNFGNPDLKWETSTTSNGGIDFGLFKGRLTGSVDYFYKKTTDVLFERTLAQPAPNGKIWVNLDGYVLNKGVEISVTGGLIRQSDINWNITGNATFLNNIVKGLTGFYETGVLRGQGFSNVYGQRVVSGQPLNVWYLGIFEGIDKTTGQSIYTGGDPSANKFYVGSPNPKFLLGLSTDFSYKKFTATLNMNGSFGQYIFNNTEATVLGIGNLGSRNVAKNVINSDVQEAISNAPAPSTRNLEKGNYVKMSNATLSYSIGNLGKVIKNLNISLTGQNLFIITKYTGFDPEVNTDGGLDGIPSLGIDYVPYPSARTIILGVNFSL
ncbi:SusC/RagA family TonB-linked outer membrane protein [Panacibacter ginsenosidivorans]|uniref:SusC/RagA family TonB-linked outer membrane protein n=2 Tax=Panacibacter ginsenosidivorans TaxID=1813871 RepID=A0A5B8VBH5_9BACT|nr:SusC/RagA family TonB-linked outer membrane protein [Panacibacter ginsenosidivorans]